MSKMEWTKCPNGHQYSPELPVCPYCPAPVSGTSPDRRDTPAGATLVDAGAATAPDNSAKTRVLSTDSAPVRDAGADKTVVDSPAPESATHVVGEASTSAPRAAAGVRQTRIMTLDDDAPPPMPIFAWLVVMEGAQQYHDFRISQEQVYIGGSDECDIVLEDEFISGEHASIRFRDDTFTITDLDSKNGTFVNDLSSEARIDRVSLKDGDEIQIGRVLIKFKCL